MESGELKNKGKGFAFSVDGHDIVDELAPLKQKATETVRIAEKTGGMGFKKGALITGAVLAAGAATWALWEGLRGKKSREAQSAAR